MILEQLPIEREGLTTFTWSRFLVPWLCDYEGLALFMDSDVLVRGDISELFAAHDGSAVMVGDVEPFERASVMLLDCGHRDNRILTPEYIETAGALHKMQWTNSVGFFPKEWNHVVFYDAPDEAAKLVHYTAGIPVFPEIKGCEHTDAWFEEFAVVNSSLTWKELMGRSVHVPKVIEFNRERENAQ